MAEVAITAERDRAAPLEEKEAWVLRVLGIAVTRDMPSEASMREAVRDMLQTLQADLKLLAGASGIETALRLFNLGVDAAKTKDYHGALEALGDCTDCVTKLRRAASAAEAQGSVVPGTVRKAVAQLELAEAAWATGRLQALDGMNALRQELDASDDPQLNEISGRIRVLTDALSPALGAAIMGLRQKLQEAGDAAAARRRVDDMLAEAAAFQAANAAALQSCEESPWDIAIAIRAPLAGALEQIKVALATT